MQEFLYITFININHVYCVFNLKPNSVSISFKKNSEVTFNMFKELFFVNYPAEF